VHEKVSIVYVVKMDVSWLVCSMVEILIFKVFIKKKLMDELLK